MFTSPEDRRTWAVLSRASLASNTWRSYDTKFAQFAKFCEQYGLQPLPAATSTVLRYTLQLFRDDRVHGASLQPYLSAINRMHRDHSLPVPASGHLVSTVRRGFVKLHTANIAPRPGTVTSARSSARAPLPPAVAFKAVQLGLAPDTDDLLRCCCAIVVHAFLFSARASSVVGVPVSAYSFHDDGSLVFREDFRKTGGSSRLLTVPFVAHPLGDLHPLRFLRVFHAARLSARAAPDIRRPARALFFHSGLDGSSASAFVSDALQRVLAAIHFSVPSGVSYSSHSLRSGAATAALAIGAPLPVVMGWGSWRSLTSVQRYIDATVTPTASASVFFAFLRR